MIVIVVSIILCITLAACSSQKTTNEKTQNKEQVKVAEHKHGESENKIALKEVKIPGPVDGTELYLRNKYEESEKKFSSNEIVLFLEPYSVPTAEAFDVPGVSWMEEYAKDGYDTWAMDFRGFGKSTWPAEMSKPATENPPVIKAEDAVKDLETAVNYIKKTRKVDKISIVGWSWGAVVAMQYANENSDNIEKLVLYGAMHGFSLPSMAKLYEAPDKPGVINANMPAYQMINFDKGMHHWHMMLDGRDLVSDKTMESVRKVFVASDEAAEKNPEMAIRRVNGPLVDLYNIWSNKPFFDVSKITAPVLVISGEDDFFADRDLIKKLTGTKTKKEVIVPEATHWMLYEKTHNTLLEETDKFLKN
ncbi:alpha/beta hydrolase [Bacillus sp. DNRA2]|nr:alpha/beta hydrolase [Bacillus sp. DNRA2]